MANFITIFRVILGFFAIGLLFFPSVSTYTVATFLTVIVIWFDGLDGFIARKFNEVSKFGGILDIMGDRIVENIYWIAFAVLGWINVIIPLIVLTRGIITDSLRTVAFEKGYTAFGAKTMMKNKFRRFLVASNFSRFTYAVTKAVAFVFIIAGQIPTEYPFKEQILSTGIVCAVIAVIFCLARGIPVMIESREYLK